jgi:hypothetical protein
MVYLQLADALLRPATHTFEVYSFEVPISVALTDISRRLSASSAHANENCFAPP